jgi:hypothetical protein
MKISKLLSCPLTARPFTNVHCFIVSLFHCSRSLLFPALVKMARILAPCVGDRFKAKLIKLGVF